MILVSALGTNCDLELLGTWLGQELEGFGTKGLRHGLDNMSKSNCFKTYLYLFGDLISIAL